MPTTCKACSLRGSGVAARCRASPVWRRTLVLRPAYTRFAHSASVGVVDSVHRHRLPSVFHLDGAVQLVMFWIGSIGFRNLPGAEVADLADQAPPVPFRLALDLRRLVPNGFSVGRETRGPAIAGSHDDHVVSLSDRQTVRRVHDVAQRIPHFRHVLGTWGAATSVPSPPTSEPATTEPAAPPAEASATAAALTAFAIRLAILRAVAQIFVERPCADD